MTERFTLLSELGRGGMGVVWKARDEQTGQIVALKLLHAAFAADPDYVTRFERELELARRIHSANVIEVLGYGVRDGVPYLALEYVGGPSLRELLATHGPYSWPETTALLVQIAQGLVDAHAAGVIHRDLKPSNVLIRPDGVARIADFGIAKGLDLTRVTGTSTLLGTPTYLAPEGPIDERSDLYSLGIIGYELLTGAAPFAGTTYQEVIVHHIREAPNLAKLPVGARPIIGWLLAKDPAHRPQRASALLPVLYGASPAPAVAQPAAQVAAAAAAPARPVSAEPTGAKAHVAEPRPTASPAPSPKPARQSAPPAVPAHDADRLLDRPPAATRRGRVPVLVSLGAASLVVCLLAVGALAFGALGSGSATPTPSVAAATPTSPPAIGAFGQTGSMTAARSGHTATLLSDGRVLVAGGSSGTGVLASAELYDPKTRTFSPTGSISTPRYGHSATLLPDGRVLVAGGYGGWNTAELYDPRTGTFSPTGPMLTARAYHTATLLPDGRVLVAGGETNTADLYDPKSGTFSPTGSMLTVRAYHTATLLPDGRVLVAGGSGDASAEIYDPRTGTFSPTGSISTPRYGHTATLLPDGRVLVVGGSGDASAEIYAP